MIAVSDLKVLTQVVLDAAVWGSDRQAQYLVAVLRSRPCSAATSFEYWASPSGTREHQVEEEPSPQSIWAKAVGSIRGFPDVDVFGIE